MADHPFHWVGGANDATEGAGVLLPGHKMRLSGARGGWPGTERKQLLSGTC